MEKHISFSLSADSGIHETDSFNVSNETIVETVRKRKSSLGFNGRKVSFSRQISSNSNAASEETGNSGVLNDEILSYIFVMWFILIVWHPHSQ